MTVNEENREIVGGVNGNIKKKEGGGITSGRNRETPWGTQEKVNIFPMEK